MPIDLGILGISKIYSAQDRIKKVYKGTDLIYQIAESGLYNLPREVSQSGYYQYPSSNFAFTLPEEIEELDDYSLQFSFSGCNTIISADLHNVKKVGRLSLSQAFSNCQNITSIDLSGVTVIDSSAMNNICSNCPSLTNIDLSNLTTINGDLGFAQSFIGCTALETLSIPKLTSAGLGGLYYLCQGCTSLRTVDLRSLTSIGIEGFFQGFSKCSNLTSVNLSGLTTVTKDSMRFMFTDCTSLTNITFNSLTTFDMGTSESPFGFTFDYSGIRTISFPAFTTATIASQSSMSGLLGNSIDGCTIHLPSNLNGRITNRYFGGTNTVLAFDLAATS